MGNVCACNYAYVHYLLSAFLLRALRQLARFAELRIWVLVDEEPALGVYEANTLRVVRRDARSLARAVLASGLGRGSRSGERVAIRGENYS